VLARQTRVVGAARAGRPVDLGEDLERLATLALQRVAEDLLGLRVRVDIRGVEGRDAGVEGRVDARRRDVVLDLAAVGEPLP
jgi:hypothetical protein